MQMPPTASTHLTATKSRARVCAAARLPTGACPPGVPFRHRKTTQLRPLAGLVTSRPVSSCLTGWRTTPLFRTLRPTRGRRSLGEHRPAQLLEQCSAGNHRQVCGACARAAWGPIAPGQDDCAQHRNVRVRLARHRRGTQAATLSGRSESVPNPATRPGRGLRTRRIYTKGNPTAVTPRHPEERRQAGSLRSRAPPCQSELTLGPDGSCGPRVTPATTFHAPRPTPGAAWTVIYVPLFDCETTPVTSW